MARITATTADRIAAATAAVQALLLLGYAVSIAVVAAARGIEGPAEVSSPAGVVVEIATFALLGAGVAVVAYGRWRGRSWSSVPFVVVQLLALTAGVPMLLGSGAGVPAGALVCTAALVGLVALGTATAQRGADDAAAARPGAQRARNP